MKQRNDLTKQSGGGLSKAKWKDQLQQRCLTKLKSRRQDKLDKFKETPEQLHLLISQEIAAIQEEDNALLSDEFPSEQERMNLLHSVEDFFA